MTLPNLLAHLVRFQPFRVLPMVAIVVALAGCTQDRAGLSSSGTTSGVSPGSCSTPSEGCACEQPGSVAECGVEKSRAGDYVSCSIGQRTCSAGKWGACASDGASTRFVSLDPSATGNATESASGGGLGTKTLGSSTSCKVTDPCDPYCNRFSDTPSGISDAGPGLTVAETGITLNGTVVTNSQCTQLVLTPSTANLIVTSMSALPSVQFTPSLLPMGCAPGAINALWATSRFDISTIDSNGKLSLISPIAGPITVTAYAGSLTATAAVNVTVNVVDDSLAPGGYSSANAAWAAAPSVVDNDLAILYPYTDTVLPLGLLSPLLQWKNNAVSATVAAQAVKVTLRYPATGAATFSWSQIQPESSTSPTPTLSAKPRSFLPQDAWRAFELTAQGQDAQFVVQRIVSGNARIEKTATVHIATGQLKGTVYYNSYGTNLVKNYSATYNGASFGAATLAVKPGQSVPTVIAGGNGCRVCHSVSSDGSVLVTDDGSLNARLYRNISTVPTEQALGDWRYNWPAIYPDGSQLFGNAYGAAGSAGMASYLYSLNNASLGAQIAATGLGGFAAAMPNFDAAGARVGFNLSAGSLAGINATRRDLFTMDFNNATKTFSGAKRIVALASPYSAVWPTFLPTGQDGMVYERETTDAYEFGHTRSGCDQRDSTCNDNGKTADLWYVNTTNAAQPVLMRRANGFNSSGALEIPTGPNNHSVTFEGQINYEPTTNPSQTGGYSWVVFTSRRMYGNVATINPWWSDPRWKDISQEPTTKKLWVAAIKNNPVAGSDPSYPAFYLAGQELLAGNSRGFWVLDQCKAPNNVRSTATECDSDLDCCGAPSTAVCSLQTPIANPAKRHCIPIVASACIADNSATSCSVDSQCCGFGSGSRCANGVCKVPPPIIQYGGASTFIRDFQAVCGAGTRPLWRFYDWQALIPSGTRIDFAAYTSDTSGTLGSSAPVSVGSATADTATWTHLITAGVDKTVDNQLVSAGQISRSYLRVTAVLFPRSDNLATPTLTQWRQTYSCVPQE